MPNGRREHVQRQHQQHRFLWLAHRELPEMLNELHRDVFSHFYKWATVSLDVERVERIKDGAHAEAFVREHRSRADDGDTSSALTGEAKRSRVAFLGENWEAYSTLRLLLPPEWHSRVLHLTEEKLRSLRVVERRVSKARRRELEDDCTEDRRFRTTDIVRQLVFARDLQLKLPDASLARLYENSLERWCARWGLTDYWAREHVDHLLHQWLWSSQPPDPTSGWIGTPEEPLTGPGGDPDRRLRWLALRHCAQKEVREIVASSEVKKSQVYGELREAYRLVGLSRRV